MTDGDILEALRTVVDPELGVNIVDLGLVYRVEVVESRIEIDMTMTSPACPLRDYLERMVVEALADLAGDVYTVEVAVVDDPPWSEERVSDAGRAQLGLGGR